MTPYTCEGILIWDDPDDPKVANIVKWVNGKPVVDLVLQQTLAEVWRKYGNLTPVKVTVEVTE